MILEGNPRGGAKNLALHLLKSENEHVEVHNLRGFVSDDLISALNEVHAVSRGTKAKQFLFSLSLNPPPEENVPTEVFEAAIGRVEQKLGLTDQPRAIVFHEKGGRRHCHAVWSRIDTENMKAIPLPWSKYKLRDISRELYLEHGWTMPRGYMASEERDPKNFTLAQWQQAKRVGKDPRAIKQAFQECWAVSDNQKAFRQALKEHGYTLARGDRRGFVALDHRCEVFAVAKWAGVRTKEVHSRLQAPASLPSVDEAKGQIARDMTNRLRELREQQDSAIKTRIAQIEQKRKLMAQKHAEERQAIKEKQQQRWKTETRIRQEHFNKGLRGLLDYVTGERRRIKEQNEAEANQAIKRDQQERDCLVFAQLDQRRILYARNKRVETFRQDRSQSLTQDIDQYKEISAGKQDVANFKQRLQTRRSLNRPRRER